MAVLLLDRIHAQIRERAVELQPAAREYARLEAALTALGGLGEAPVPVASPPRAAKHRPKAPVRAYSKRAPRGANRAAALAAIAERPGVTASELSKASGVGKPVLYALLKTLEEQGEVARENLPSGTAGFRLTPVASSETPGVWRTASDAG